jgi:hypothetical protein
MNDAAIGEVEPFDRAMNLTYRSPVALFRGEPNGDIDEVADLVARIPDPQAGADLDRAKAYAALVAGDGAGTFELAMASGEASTTNGPAPFALAARGALWIGDLERARTARDRFAGLGYHWRSSRGPHVTAGIAASKAPREALASYRETWLAGARSLRLRPRARRATPSSSSASTGQLRTAADEARATSSGSAYDGRAAAPPSRPLPPDAIEASDDREQDDPA